MKNNSLKLPFRQVHMDFHTSPHIPNVGEGFNADEFAQTLKKAHVNSVTVFSKCHHGLSYHPTEVGLKHPTLKIDMLGEMIKACHQQGIKAPVYFSVTRDDYAGEIHPEWRQIDSDGRLGGRAPLQKEKGWANLCLNSPYVDYLASQVSEVMENYPVDGVFFDIVYQLPPGCCCNYCMKSIKELGLTPEKESDLAKHSLIIERRFMKRIYELVKGYESNATIWFNSRTRILPEPEEGMRPELPFQTHIEIESLPSGGWNYNHWPMFVRYYQGFGKDLLGMTGRFHKSWGDFGGLKNPAALEYECFSCLSRGAKISVGDQLHPNGILDKKTYELLGNIFERVEELEPFVENSTPMTQIAILLGGESSYDTHHNPHLVATEGAMRVLLESHHQFDIVDKESDFSKYQLIIAPDVVRFSENLTTKIQEFISKGGKLILSHQSGLSTKSDKFVLPKFELTYEGPSPYSVEYLDIGEEWGKELSGYQFVVYEQGSRVKGGDKRKVRATVSEPYFERTWEHYVSHAQTPVDKKTDYPAIHHSDSIIYLSHPLFTAYKEHGNLIYKKIVQKSIDNLLVKPLVRTNLPSTAQVTLTRRQGRLVVHILHYIPQRRADIDIIEDIIPIVDTELEINTGKEPTKIYLAPEIKELQFEYKNGVVSFKVDRIDGYQVIALEY